MDYVHIGFVVFHVAWHFATRHFVGDMWHDVEWIFWKRVFLYINSCTGTLHVSLIWDIGDTAPILLIGTAAVVVFYHTKKPKEDDEATTQET